MCGRYGFGNPARLGSLPLGVDLPPLGPRFNVAPSQAVPLVGQEANTRFAALANWGLIPFWAKDPGIGRDLANARADGIASKPSFRAAFKARRAVLPADLYYEWQVVPGHKGKQPWCIRMPDEAPFVMAALFERWAPVDDPVAQSRLTCCVITTEANAATIAIHHRMPAIIPVADIEVWLNPATPSAVAQALLRPYEGPLVTYQVKTWVNTASHDDAQCAAPLERWD